MLKITFRNYGFPEGSVKALSEFLTAISECEKVDATVYGDNLVIRNMSCISDSDIEYLKAITKCNIYDITEDTT